MKRAILATLGLALAVVVGFGLLGSTERVSANHIVAPDEITISTTAGLVAVGAYFNVDLAVTTANGPAGVPPGPGNYKAIQLEQGYTTSTLLYIGPPGCEVPAGSGLCPTATYTATTMKDTALAIPLGLSWAGYSLHTPTAACLIASNTNMVAGGDTVTCTAAFTGAAPVNGDSYKVSNFTCSGELGGGTINFAAETETYPTDIPVIPGFNSVGNGANCASLAGGTGISTLGRAERTTYQCIAVGSGLVAQRPKGEPANITNDAAFGTTLISSAPADIPTTLENQIPVPAPFGPTQAAIGVACAKPVDYSVQKSPATQNVSGDAPNNVITQTISIANPDFLTPITGSGATVTYTATTMTDTSKAFTPNALAGATITSGANSCTIASNTATQVTCSAAWSPATPAAGDAYTITGFAHAVFLDDTLPAGAASVSVAPGPGASCTVGPAPAAAAGPSPPYYGPGPFSGAAAGHVVCIGKAPGGGTLSAVLTYNATPAQDCSTMVDSVLGGPGDTTTADNNPGNNAAGGQAVVDCPVLTTTKAFASPQPAGNCQTPATQCFTDDLVAYTITVANDGPATGSTAHAVVLHDVTTGSGQTLVGTITTVPATPCNGTAVLDPCALGDIAANGSVVITFTMKMPAVANASSCDTASATQAAPGSASNSSQKCVKVVSKFPQIDGFAKDTGITPTNPDGSLNNNFSFTFGNLFLCKPLGGTPPGGLPAPGAFSGAGQSACGVFKIAEIIQEPFDIDSCVDDDDNDGKGCQGDPNFTRWPYQALSDKCRNLASDYIAGVTAVDCGSPITGPGRPAFADSPATGTNLTNEHGEGLGAAEFQVKFDDKIFQSPTFDCLLGPAGQAGVLGSTGRVVQTQVSIITENWVQFGCVTKNPTTYPPANGAPETGAQCANNIDDDGDGVINDGCPPPTPPALAVRDGADITNASVLGTLTLTVQADLLSRMRPAKENGVTTNLLDENCEKADTLGQPFNEVMNPNTGFVTAPSGGLSKDCKDAAITIRMLEGDVNLDCQVDISDDQAMAFRYGQFFGQLAYNRFFDLEPNIAPDFDIDIKDLQTVFGRNGSTCKAPIPTQNPNPSTPDP